MKPPLYAIIEDALGEPLVIKDIGHDCGCQTITNGAEIVVQQLTRDKFLPAGRRLLYFDSVNLLSEILHDRGVFIGFKDCPL